MPILRHNIPNHSLLLMPVRLGNERWPKNKVRILSCDIDGNLFTQLIGRSVYRRIKEKTQQRESSRDNYATIYWDSGGSKLIPVFVEIGKKEIWALERILEHAISRAVIPDLLKSYPAEIIKLGGNKYQQTLAGRTTEKHKTATDLPSRALCRLPYYRKQDMELSVPIYKAAYAFPLIVLKSLPQGED
ncbi:MAG: hypothetical protein PHU23_17000, partial [Dehalococcoidales bacterium]|nr:hypothetical protein [Dehalococcoidales bacterium]